MPKLIVYDESPDAPIEVLECSLLGEDEFVTGPERDYKVFSDSPYGSVSWVCRARSRNHALHKFLKMSGKENPTNSSTMMKGGTQITSSKHTNESSGTTYLVVERHDPEPQ